MPHKVISPDPDLEMLRTVARLFRDRGFEGTSLSLIMEETGLSKASLYHRFPGGKQEMALEVLEQTATVFSQHLLAPLSEEGDPRRRLKRTTGRLREFYESGWRPCLMETMTLSFDLDSEIHAAVRACLRYWLETFAEFAGETMPTRTEALRAAEQAVSMIEGSLILSRGIGSTQPFSHALRELASILIAPSNRDRSAE